MASFSETLIPPLQDDKKTTKTPQNIVPKEEEGENIEEGECGFCIFMKGGGCKDSFVAWENCIQESEENNEDIVEKCFQVTGDLKMCMEAYSEYYSPILQAEKAAEKELQKELDKEDLKIYDPLWSHRRSCKYPDLMISVFGRRMKYFEVFNNHQRLAYGLVIVDKNWHFLVNMVSSK